MARAAEGSLIQQIEILLDGGSVAGLTDRQLLARFTTERDSAREAAFAALVTRHGPMVLEVCRQLLGDLHHAEDAFQAVFLVLARKAGSIRDPDLLGNWLYGVALRTARKAKVRLARQRQHEEGDSMRRPGSGSSVQVEPMVQPAEQPALAREQGEALHEEIGRLPGSFRLPVVLCYFEGLTLDEAARRLGWPAGTVRSRLARARDKLRRGLTRRGVSLPAAALTAALGPRSATAHISSSLCDATTRAALQFAVDQTARGVVPATAAVLAQEVLRSMLINKLRLTILTVVILGAFVTGAGYLAHALAAMKDEPKAALAERPAKQNPAPQRMIVTGRVLDPDGKPVRGAAIDIVGRPRKPWVGASDEQSDHEILGRGEADADGRFRFEVPRTSSDLFFEVQALAIAPGYALGWAQLNADAEQPAADVRLRPEQVVQVKVVDVNGQPARGVELGIGLHVLSVPSSIGASNGVSLGGYVPKGLRTWPGSTTTDDQGRLTLRGIGRDLGISISIRDPRFARQGVVVQAGSGPSAETKSLVLQPAQIIEGRVLAADTGQPIPNAIVAAGTQVETEFARGFHTGKFRADADGRFRINPMIGSNYTLEAFPPAGQPYLIHQEKLAWTKGVVKMTHDIKLPRGVILRGKVVEQGTGRPLAGSSIQFFPMPSRRDLLDGSQAIVASGQDGSFEIVVPAGKGHLLVFGPTTDYILEKIGGYTLTSGKLGGMPNYAHDILSYDVKAGSEPRDVNATLRPGKTIRGHVRGADGQTVQDAEILTTLHIEHFNVSWRGDYTLPVRDGRFEIHGLDPDKEYRAYFFDAEHECGAAVTLSGERADQQLAVQLQPCGQAVARFVGPDGKPLPKHIPHLEFMATPGPTLQAAAEQRLLARDSDLMFNVDRRHYDFTKPRTTDAEGRITLPALIPGVLYRLLDFSTVNDAKGEQLRKDFTVKPGETIDLGDILIVKP